MSALSFTQPLAAPPARVFAALTEARHLERWFCDRAEVTLGVGGPLVLSWTRAGSSASAYAARWLEWWPPTRAAFRGGHAGYPNGDAGTVGFTIAPEGTGSRVELKHEFPAGDAYAPFQREWEQAWPRALARLAAYLAPFPAPSS